MKMKDLPDHICVRYKTNETMSEEYWTCQFCGDIERITK